MSGEERDLCGACGLPLVDGRQEWESLDQSKFCGAEDDFEGAALDCAVRVIALREAELSTMRKLAQPEQEVVEAAIFFCERDAGKVSGYTSVELLTEAVDALLAHRAYKATMTELRARLIGQAKAAR